MDYNSYPKLHINIVYFTSYSVINVRLAAQMLSTTVSKPLSNYGPADAAKFCLMFAKFFNLINVSITTALLRKLKPFSWTDSPGFSMLKNLFL